MVLTNNTNTSSFFHFIIWNPRNRKFLFIALGGTIVQFIIFKILYPFPDFFSDSYSYIYAAQANLDISIWPIGYSKFLRWFHFITYSDTALISFQYFFYELSALYFFFSFLYFYKPVKTNEIILFIFLFFNPLFLYLCNYVNSDPLFLALSLFWFTELLWIINRPRMYQIFVQAVLLFACFTVRNNAYYYPVIAALAFVLSRQTWRRRVAGALLGVALIIPFIIHTRNEAYKMTGTKQFSLFTGWQLANNALYAFEYMDTTKILPSQVNDLDKMSLSFFRQVPTKFLHEYLLSDQGNFFIRASYSPLKQFMLHHYQITDEYSNIVAWGKSSAVFSEYGRYLITHNPRAYIWEFMIPNTKNYFIPYLEKLQVYNLGLDNIESNAAYWFHYKSNTVTSFSKTGQGNILYLYPAIFLSLNIYLIVIGLWFLFKKVYLNTEVPINRMLILSGLTLCVNFCFCIFSTIIVFRYQVFPIIICLSLALLLTEFIDKQELKNRIVVRDKGQNMESRSTK